MQIDFEIRQASEGDIPSLYILYDILGKKDDGYFEACFEKECFILIASQNKKDVGFGVLNFEPKYNLYKKLDIPEIQDLNVIPAARGQGIAIALMEAFENIARDQGAEQIGVSVGLNKSYGAAQRLYAKLGYIPDGYGVTYDREQVSDLKPYPIDDELALMLLKEL